MDLSLFFSQVNRLFYVHRLLQMQGLFSPKSSFDCQLWLFANCCSRRILFCYWFIYVPERREVNVIDVVTRSGGCQHVQKGMFVGLFLQRISEKICWLEKGMQGHSDQIKCADADVMGGRMAWEVNAFWCAGGDTGAWERGNVQEEQQWKKVIQDRKLRFFPKPRKRITIIITCSNSELFCWNLGVSVDFMSQRKKQKRLVICLHQFCGSVTWS